MLVLAGHRRDHADWRRVWVTNPIGSIVIVTVFAATPAPDAIDGAVGRAALAMDDRK